MKLAILLSMGICVSSGAPPAKTPALAPKPGQTRTAALELTEAQVEKWAKIWQKRLSLEDWDIGIQVVRATELKPDTLGNLRWNSGAKTATIRVLNPADYDLPAAEIPTDIEYTVVHELIHLQLAALPRDSSNKSIEERVVNRIAEALFSLEKGPSYRPRAAVAHLQAKDKSSSEASRAARP